MHPCCNAANLSVPDCHAPPTSTALIHHALTPVLCHITVCSCHFIAILCKLEAHPLQADPPIKCTLVSGCSTHEVHPGCSSHKVDQGKGWSTQKVPWLVHSSCHICHPPVPQTAKLPTLHHGSAHVLLPTYLPAHAVHCRRLHHTNRNTERKR
jgi:hypothetical protein